MLSQAVEDYLKVIFKLSSEGKRVSNSEIARRLGVVNASVTGMLKKLADMHLVDYSRYRGVELTESGKKIAVEMIRHHRLLELYLKEAMGYTWDKVHDEAENLEHHISEEFEEKIDEFLGRPETDPHGSPIPTKDGKIAPTPSTPLSSIPVGKQVIILRVSDSNAEMLRYLGGLNLYPRTHLTIIEREPFNGSTRISAHGVTCSLSPELCEAIFVEIVEE